MDATHLNTNATDLDRNRTPFTNNSACVSTSMITNQSFIYLMIEASMIPLILLSNLLIIGTVIFSAPLRKPRNVLISSLAIADFAVGAVVLPYDLLYNLVSGVRNLEAGCVVQLCLWVCGLGLSITHLFAIALERFLAIQFPFLYRTSYTKSRLVTVAVFVWTICIGLGSGAFLVEKKWNAEHGCNMRGILTSAYGRVFTFYQIFLILSTLFIYFRVLCVIRQHRKIRTQMISSSLVAERRRSIVSFLVFVLFLLFWGPASLNGILSRILGATDLSLSKSLALLATANSFINFIVYGLKNREMRMVWKKMLPYGQAASATRGVQSQASRACHIPEDCGVSTVCHVTPDGEAGSAPSTSVSMVNLGETGEVQ